MNKLDFCVCAACVACCSTSLRAQTTTRISVDSAGVEANELSLIPEPSRDGRFVAFESVASNLVAGDTNAQRDIFVRDRLTDQTTRVSVKSSGGQGSGHRPGISADGRFVVFRSSSSLVAGDSNGTADIYVRDRQLATTTRVSVTSSGAQVQEDCEEATISGDGSRVSFMSLSNALVPGDTNGFRDVFVHDRASGQTQCASVDPLGAPANGESIFSALSADGRWIAFDSNATNLVTGGNPYGSVFVRDLSTGVTSFVARGSNPDISDDGSVVVFNCPWDNVVSGDNNGFADVLVRDMSSGVLSAASVSSDGTMGNGSSSITWTSHSVISGDGRFVIFESSASNLVGVSLSAVQTVYVHDRVTGLTELVNVDSNGVQSDQNNLFAAISGDGLTAFFCTAAANLVAGDTNGHMDVFAHEVVFTPVSYCTPATTGAGCTPTIRATGVASASSTSGFTLEVPNAESNKNGMFFYGLGATSVPFAPGNTSVLCVSAPRQRTALSNTGGPPLGTCDGALVLDWNAWVSSHPSALGAPFVAGLALYAQGWFRDPLAPGGSNLSDALLFVLRP